jgi:hypothetical protein
MNQEELRELEEILLRRIKRVDSDFLPQSSEALRTIAEGVIALILLMPHLKD